MTSQMIIQSIVNSILIGMTLILIALGLTLIFGIMRVVNFAHGDFYMLGGFGIWYFFTKQGWNFFSAMLFSMMVVGILGVIIERLVFKPFRENPLPSMIVSLGLLLILRSAAQFGFGLEDQAVPLPDTIRGVIHVFGATLSKERLTVIVITLTLILSLYFFIKFTNMGAAMRAVADDLTAASLQGIDVDKISSLAFFIGCVLAAAAGCLTGPIFYVSPTMGMQPGIMAFVVIVIGGLGSIPGTIVAGLVIGFIQGFGAIPFGANYSTIMVYIALIILLILKPMGFFGHAER